MFYNAKQGQAVINGTTMNYLTFGKGQKPLVMIPGLGDGLQPVHGRMQAVSMALAFQQFAKEFRVYLFSRKNVLEEGYTTKDMARDQKQVLDSLGIKKFYLLGVSEGGMIAQHLAIDYPESVEKLVIGVSSSRCNELINQNVHQWMDFAKADAYKALMIDTCEKTYSPKTLKKYRLLYPLIGKIGKPEDFSRFLIQANACLTHNTYEELEKIKCPTLIIGGKIDKVLGVDASVEMAEKIKESKLKIYEELGHGAFDEGGVKFQRQIVDFLSEDLDG